MARLTVTQIMTQIAATVNQEATAPSTGSAEYALWLAYLNRAYSEWAEAYDWEILRKSFFPSVTGTSLASVSLPLDYRKMAKAAIIRFYGDTDETTRQQFPEITPEQESLYKVTDKYFKIVGDFSNGITAVFHPGTLASGVSLEFQYFSTPTSLASPAEVPLLQDPQFLVDRTIGFIFEARSDPRFQQEETKARERLLTMVDNANDAKFGSFAGPNNLITTERKIGFRLGRD